MTDARMVMLRAMSEANLMRTIINTAKMHGWRVHHDPPVHAVNADGSTRYRTALNGDPGFPDLVMARAGEVIIVECKRQTGARWQPGQREWLDALGARVVMPEDMDGLLRRLRMVPRSAHAHVWTHYGGSPAPATGPAFCACGWRRLADGTLRSGMQANP